MPALYTQPPFSDQLSTLAYPLTNGPAAGATLQTGYMVWAPPYIPGYGSTAVIQYLYNPSTVSSDYNIADATAQAALNFPNPGDSANLAIPLSQTATWSLMFDRTFEVWGAYNTDGLPSGSSSSTDPAVIGVQADVLAFMQFTGMQSNYSSTTTNGTAGTVASLSASTGIMQLVPCWAVFGNSNVTNGLLYYGYINEWSVQYTHWTQYNVPFRAVISVNFTMLPNPSNNPVPANPISRLLPVGPGPGNPLANGSTFTTSGIGGR